MSEAVVRPQLWTMTASDTSSGAGMQADLAVAHNMGVQCGCVVIAITSQNSRGVAHSHTLDLDLIQQQWQALAADGWPAVIRLGWLPAEQAFIDWLLARLQECQALVVWDPVLGATRVNRESGELGSGCGGDAGLQQLRRLLPHIDVLTPNQAEARLLAGLDNSASQTLALDSLLELGVRSVLLSGGDALAEDDRIYDWFAQRVAADNQNPEELAVDRFVISHPRLPLSAHGTGCHLAAGLASALARGERLYDAVVTAIRVARASLAQATERASGYHNCFATLEQSSWPELDLQLQVVPRQPVSDVEADVAKTLDEVIRMPLQFPKLDRPLGLYGLVDNLEWLQRLLELGVDTLQWRVKTPTGDFREQTAEAIRMCEQAGVPLYINDYWQLALELGAWGVHLGQEDLATADLYALAEAGIALGVSTHTEWEILRARAVRPSYIAFGPIYPPLSKKLKYPPLGIKRVGRWVAANPDYPHTTIGGITADNIGDVMSTGIGSAAIVSELRNDTTLPERLAILRQYL